MNNRSDLGNLGNFIYSVINMAIAEEAAKRQKQNSYATKEEPAKTNSSCAGKCEGCGRCNQVDEDYVPPLTNLIDKVIFDDPMTMILWADGDKTTVRCNKEDTFSKEVGLAMAIIKKLFGNSYYKQITYLIDQFSVDQVKIRAKKAAKKAAAKKSENAVANIAEKVAEEAKVRKPRTPKTNKAEEAIVNN